ncbi:hypothetical protein [Ekhidna sp. To15]|uniref:hypothetical protein n=1 Tax=Ekhidna sp. To15 TaxID=3395267 RepID=UPI003F52632D
MNRIFVVTVWILSLTFSYGQSLLETKKWTSFFTERPYLTKAQSITDETFWEIDASYTYYTSYPVLLVYEGGGAVEINWSYSGLPSLIDKKKAFEDMDFQRYEKENIVYIVFDGYLFKNPFVGNAIDGDFMIVYEEGPISIYREYYTSPITRENISSAFAIYKESQLDDTFYLGKFEKKAAKLVNDYPKLAKKIQDKIIGYRNEEDDIIRIAQEYNALVKENNPYRYEDHYLKFWQRKF